jgi:hypothetical protein
MVAMTMMVTTTIAVATTMVVATMTTYTVGPGRLKKP